MSKHLLQFHRVTVLLLLAVFCGAAGHDSIMHPVRRNETKKGCVPMRDALESGAGFGELCERDADCTSSFSHCDKLRDCAKGVCQCRKWYLFKGKSCRLAVLFGDSCRANSHCDAEGAVCDSGKCECRDPTARPTSDKTVCVKTHLKSFGETCLAPTDCKAYYHPVIPTMKFNFAVACDSSKCKCQAGYKETAGNCQPLEQGQECSNRTTCAFTPCVAGICQCSASTRYAEYHIGNGMLVRRCVHMQASIGLNKGDMCHVDVGERGRFCGKNLVCASCPDVPDVLKCMSGSDVLATSYGVLVAALIFWVLSQD